MSRESPALASRVSELGRNPSHETATVWLTKPDALLTVTDAPGPAPGAGTVTEPGSMAGMDEEAAAGAGKATGAANSTIKVPSRSAVESAQATRKRAPSRGVHPTMS